MMKHSRSHSTHTDAETRKHAGSRPGPRKARAATAIAQQPSAKHRVSHVTRRIGDEIVRDRHDALRELADRLDAITGLPGATRSTCTPGHSRWTASPAR